MATAVTPEGLADVQEHTVQRWKEEQLQLKRKLITSSCVEWLGNLNKPDRFNQLRLVGGVDVSFQKGDDNHACACLVVLSFPDLKVVYSDLEMVHLTAPYIPEFLAFREVQFLMNLINRLKERNPQFIPQVIMVDGNGMLHPRGFGIACHLGVLTDIPTIGVAKTLFHVDGIEKTPDYIEKIKNSLPRGGDVFPLVGDSGTTWGKALRSTDAAPNPIFVSVGHRIGLECAVKLVHRCCEHRVPEPTRQADILSRKYIRENYEKEVETCSCGSEFKRLTNTPNPDEAAAADRNSLIDTTLLETAANQMENLKITSWED